MTWIVGLLALAIGAALGVVITKANQKVPDTGSDKIKELEERLAQAEQASSDYQDKVSEHFVKTSELFGDMTESYRTAYQHLATGAQSLCKPGTEAALLNTSLVEQLTSNALVQQAEEQIIDVTMVDSVESKGSVDKDTSGASSASQSKLVNDVEDSVQVQVSDDKAEDESTGEEAIHVKAKEASSRPSIH